jgi:hypothetical protein
VAQAEDEPNESVLLPPALKLRLAFLRVKVHRARGLPQMDWSYTGSPPKGDAVDAYVKVRCNKYHPAGELPMPSHPVWSNALSGALQRV